jgi:sugar phosphate isomerase/epimerase
MMTNRTVMSRREVLISSALAPLALQATGAVAHSQQKIPPPLYQLSINIEQLFDANIPRDGRMKAVAAMGEKAFSFWRATEEEQKKMLEVQQQTGLKCGSVSGNGPANLGGGRGRGTGPGAPPAAAAPPPSPFPVTPSPMKAGNEKAFLGEVTTYVKVAEKFGGADAILLFGAREVDIPWETQRAELASNLRKAADIAGEHKIVLAWETTGRLLPVTEAYAILEEINHPNLKLDFDVSLIQGGQGNVITALKYGLEKNLIQLFECGDTPGRTVLGTGELNWPNLFRLLRLGGYKGWIGTEQTSINGYDGSRMTPERAVQITRAIAFGEPPVLQGG